MLDLRAKLWSGPIVGRVLVCQQQGTTGLSGAAEVSCSRRRGRGGRLGRPLVITVIENVIRINWASKNISSWPASGFGRQRPQSPVGHPPGRRLLGLLCFRLNFASFLCSLFYLLSARLRLLFLLGPPLASLDCNLVWPAERAVGEQVAGAPDQQISNRAPLVCRPRPGAKSSSATTTTKTRARAQRRLW